MSSPRSAPADPVPGCALECSLGEWIVADGSGGFASSTPSMRATRRYHGLLVAVLPGTAKRFVFVADLDESVRIGPARSDAADREDGGLVRLVGDAAPLVAFEHVPHPTMRFESPSGPAHWTLTREVSPSIGDRARATLVRYSFESKSKSKSKSESACELIIRPWLPCREADALTHSNGECNLAIEPIGQAGIRCRPYAALPAVVIVASSPSLRIAADPVWRDGVELTADLARGYDCHEQHPSPGRLSVTLQAGESVVLALSLDDALEDPAQAWAESVAHVATTRRAAASRGPSDVRCRIDATATDFLYRTEHGRLGICAGYPWFGEWGRDTFVALPGLTLARGDEQSCRAVLDGAIPFLQNGLLPNIYGAGRKDSHYGSVDASLWFARAAEIYAASVDGAGEWTRDVLRPALREIATAYRDGTDLGVGANADGLIEAGGPDLNATWMDANASDGPVTPRDGCAVEINALWYALLDHLVELETAVDGEPAPWRAERDRAGKSFVEHFWLHDGRYLADRYSSGRPDRCVRPNMVLAAALPRSPLEPAMRRGVVDTATSKLLTPRGLRTLSADDADYAPCYRGGPDERDRAYHQGTAWPWLLGFYTEACLLVRDSAAERNRLRGLWEGFAPELDRAGFDHISEVFDGDPPHDPGGTIAQAWNSAELLRSFWLLE